MTPHSEVNTYKISRIDSETSLQIQYQCWAAKMPIKPITGVRACSFLNTALWLLGVCVEWLR
jgi:hypothetical protein